MTTHPHLTDIAVLALVDDGRVLLVHRHRPDRLTREARYLASGQRRTRRA